MKTKDHTAQFIDLFNFSEAMNTEGFENKLTTFFENNVHEPILRDNKLTNIRKKKTWRNFQQI